MKTFILALTAGTIAVEMDNNKKEFWAALEPSDKDNYLDLYRDYRLREDQMWIKLAQILQIDPKVHHLYGITDKFIMVEETPRWDIKPNRKTDKSYFEGNAITSLIYISPVVALMWYVAYAAIT